MYNISAAYILKFSNIETEIKILSHIPECTHMRESTFIIGIMMNKIGIDLIKLLAHSCVRNKKFFAVFFLRNTENSHITDSIIEVLVDSSDYNCAEN